MIEMQPQPMYQRIEEARISAWSNEPDPNEKHGRQAFLDFTEPNDRFMNLASRAIQFFVATNEQLQLPGRDIDDMLYANAGWFIGFITAACEAGDYSTLGNFVLFCEDQDQDVGRSLAYNPQIRQSIIGLKDGISPDILAEDDSVQTFIRYYSKYKGVL